MIVCRQVLGHTKAVNALVCNSTRTLLRRCPLYPLVTSSTTTTAADIDAIRAAEMAWEFELCLLLEAAQALTLSTATVAVAVVVVVVVAAEWLYVGSCCWG